MVKYKTFLFIFLILAINFAAYHAWFWGNNILTYGDWGTAFPETLKEYLSLPQLWASSASFGGINLGLTFGPKLLLNGLLASFNVPSHLNDKLTYFWPTVIFSSIGFFLLGRKILKSDIAGFFSSIIFSFSVVTLGVRTGHLTIASAQAIAPFVILFLFRTFESKSIRDATITGLLGYVVSFNEFRVFYVLAWVILLYFVYYSWVIEKQVGQFIKNFLLLSSIFVIIGLLNFYWVVGFKSISPGAIGGFGFLGRQLFGSGNYDILKSLTAWNIWWTGSFQAFSIQPIPVYFWTIPLLAVLGLIVNRGNKNLVFMSLVSLVGIFLSKQSGHPFTGFYLWLYRHIPGFNAFREASKFFFLIILGYSILIAGFVDWLWRKKLIHHKHIFTRYILIFSIAALYLWNAKPLITGEIRSVFTPRHIPVDYLILKDFLLNQPDYFRTLWVPTYSKWGIFTNNHPKLSAIDLINSDWKPLTKEFREKSTRITEQEVTLDLLKSDVANELLDSSSIKYVIIPLADIENEDDFYVYYGNRQTYIDEVNKLNFLKPINIGTQELLVFENTDYKPHIYLSDNLGEITYQTSSPTQVSLKLENIKTPVYLNFTDNFHPDWKIRIGKFNWREIFSQKNYFLSEKYHTENPSQFNSFLVDPEYLINNYPLGSYRINPDGSLNISVTIYFRPQAYQNLGLIVSAMTFFACLSYLVLAWPIHTSSI